jgi:PAS domain-containing protein
MEQASPRGSLSAERAVTGLPALLDAGSFLEATPECLVVAAADGRIVFANRRLQELTGFRADELVGEPVERLLPVEPLLAGSTARF